MQLGPRSLAEIDALRYLLPEGLKRRTATALPNWSSAKQTGGLIKEKGVVLPRFVLGFN